VPLPLTTSDRAVENRGVPSRGGIGRPDVGAGRANDDSTRAGPLMRMAEAVRRAEKVAAQDELERRLDALEPKFREREAEFERRLPSIAAGARARHLHADHQRKTTSQPPRDGIGYGVEWPNKVATDLSMGHVPNPERPNRAKDEEWAAYRRHEVERLKKRGLKSVSCLTVMGESLPGYVQAQGLLESPGKHAQLEQALYDAFKRAVEARGPGVHGAPAVYGGRATVLVEELRTKFGFQTVHIDALTPGTKYWNEKNYTSHEAARGAGTVPILKSDVYGVDLHGARTGEIIDTRVKLDRYLVLGKKMNKQSHDLWETIQRAEYAVGVADSGFHTFVISGGMVYEIHWNRDAKDPTLSEASPLREFFKNRGGLWGSGVIALPPTELRSEPVRRP
jgi:hypothetical protein